MTTFGILVAVDGSPESDAAVIWAGREAAIRDLPVTVMHVVVPVLVTWPVRHLEAGYRRWQEDHAELVIDLAARQLTVETDTPGLTIQSKVRHGGAAAELIAASKKAAITVVGSRGFSGVSATLLGSVSRTLLHYACSPLAVIRPTNNRPDPSAPVLLGIDGSPASESATAFAFDEASRRGVDLVALHAWSDVGTAHSCGSDWRLYEQEGSQILAERLSGWQEQYPDVHVRRRVVCDRPAQRLIEESLRAQLVVVGRRGRGGFARLLLGSVSTAVAETSTRPVVMVPSAQRGQPGHTRLDA